MALDFPTSPTDGQIYDNYYWDDTNSRWQLLGSALEVPANFSNTPTGSYTDGYDYEYVSFTADGSLTVTRGGYADVLLVGGGGGGGRAYSAGGGAGGVLYIENAYLPAGTLDVVVGAGGVNFASTSAGDGPIVGQNGLPSSLWKYYVPGGGGGGCVHTYFNISGYDPLGGQNGGSGGGSGGEQDAVTTTRPGLGVPGLGNDGGNGAQYAGGGGGGAGAAGGASSTNVGGNGGNGIANSITGSSVTYGGGGGGGSATGGSGGTGGGGAGISGAGNGTDGTANTGGGGGGGAGTNYTGGDGGSGIVIVRVRV